jgi:outer membrane protein
LGINYTNFDKRTSTAAGNALNGGPTHISMSDSWGLAAQVGLSYRIDERWSIQGALMTARVKSRLTATTAGVPRTMDIRFRARLHLDRGLCLLSRFRPTRQCLRACR